MHEAPPRGASPIVRPEPDASRTGLKHPQLVETELGMLGSADAGAMAARSAQQVLDAVAQAVAGEGSESSSALTAIEGPRSEVPTPQAMLVVRQRSERRRSDQPGSREPDEQVVLDDIASASDDLELAARAVRQGFLRLAEIEIRKAIGLGGGAPPSRRHDDPDIQRPAAGGPTAGPEAVEVAAWTPEASAPGELYEGTVRLLVMADGNVQRIVQFVDELCQMPQFRMLRMTGSRQQDGAEISLGLREPLPFAKIVGSMPNVVRVDVPSPDEAAGDGGIGLTVHLAPAAGDDLDLALIEPPIEPEA